MRYTLGIDIGTFESKGVLVDSSGGITGSAAKAHKMIVPQPGWAEHRANEDWWDDFKFITRAILDQTGVAPGDVRAVACSAIGPCMLPVDGAGEPLMNAVLYGVDGRAVLPVLASGARNTDRCRQGKCPGRSRLFWRRSE